MSKLQIIKNKIADKFPNASGRIKSNLPMSEYSTFKVGGKADLSFFPSTIEELVYALDVSKEMQVDYTVLGNGSNILVSDKGIRGLTVIVGKDFSGIRLESSNVISADAGAMLSGVSKFAASKSLTGMEFAAGIPGTIGGAIYMNAGAYDGCMADIVLRTKGYNPGTGEIFTIEGSLSHNFAYRKSFYIDSKSIVLNIWLELKTGDPIEINKKMNDFSSRRINSQPLDLPSAGSTFKRPPGYFAGKLIEDSGLKGYRIGGAVVCEKHAGFIVNDKNATADDVYKLILHVQNEVKKNFNVELETEVRVLGEW